MKRTRLIVFARLPVLGRVKTRLAVTLGESRALQVYRRLLATTIALAEASGAERMELRVANDGMAANCNEPALSTVAGIDTADALLVTLAARGWIVAPQNGANLGERMRDALERSLEVGERPVLVGSDCPTLRPTDLVAAFTALDRVDAVFSPTEDGGYALVGVARPLPTLFESIPWGTAQVAALTRVRAAQAGARVEWLRPVWDVDVEADLRRWEATDG
jgi:rSAM/selenodomain-associated transferase 1